MAWLRWLVPTVSMGLVIAAAAMALPSVILPIAGRAEPALAFFAASPDPSRLPPEVTILGWQDHWARLDNIDAAGARALYAQGALFVMPIRRSGCVSLRKK